MSNGAEEIKNDPFDLARFLRAQQDVYATALRELQNGWKRTHWMWFIFPQIDGLGSSATTKFFAIKSRAEAVAYLQHPVLGERLRECATAPWQVEGKTARAIMGSPDDLKLRSSMTLFANVSGPESVFAQVLEKFFLGKADERTLDLLGSPGRGETESGPGWE